ncbi:MAG: 50S ribosomal protein L10 [SAR202 cluster bacterium]|nr:50S ribosomal protein L10 [SAR202 cluster bacterium]
MPTQKKIDEVTELKEKISKATIAIATNPQGLGGAAMTDLRSKLREKKIEYRMVKNTLVGIAADQAQKPSLKDVVKATTVIAFGYGEPVDAAKALDEYIRATRANIVINGALMGTQVLTAEQVSSLASLPPKSQLVAKLLGQLQLPMARLVGSLKSPISGLGIVLQARIKQMESAKPAA